MVEIAIAILRLPDGRIVLQRRDQEAPIFAGMLGFFGGHAEPEDADSKQTIIRELGEETSLDIDTSSLHYINSFEYAADVGKGLNQYKFFVYELTIIAENFDVYEGVGSEVYNRSEVLARDDITISARYTLEKLVKE